MKERKKKEKKKKEEKKKSRAQRWAWKKKGGKSRRFCYCFPLRCYQCRPDLCCGSPPHLQCPRCFRSHPHRRHLQYRRRSLAYFFALCLPAFSPKALASDRFDESEGRTLNGRSQRRHRPASEREAAGSIGAKRTAQNSRAQRSTIVLREEQIAT